jgi:Tfp pilus assembly protein PilV
VRGFSLVEALAALVILACAVLALVPLVAMSSGANGEARHLTTATLLALDKIEALRASGAFTASPPGALDQNTAGFCDFFDAFGVALAGSAGSVPVGTAFVRRWSVAIAAGTPPRQATIQVAVMPFASGVSRRRATARQRGEVRLAALIGSAP